jgi:hypothetical protein
MIATSLIFMGGGAIFELFINKGEIFWEQAASRM